MLDLFGLCPNCQLPIFITDDVSFCPYCENSLPDDDSEFAPDFLSNFMREIKAADSLEWSEIQTLIQAVETLIEINTKISQELGVSLIELDKARNRLAFYRKATTYRIK